MPALDPIVVIWHLRGSGASIRSPLCVSELTHAPHQINRTAAGTHVLRCRTNLLVVPHTVARKDAFYFSTFRSLGAWRGTDAEEVPVVARYCGRYLYRRLLGRVLSLGG